MTYGNEIDEALQNKLTPEEESKLEKHSLYTKWYRDAGDMAVLTAGITVGGLMSWTPWVGLLGAFLTINSVGMRARYGRMIRRLWMPKTSAEVTP